MRAIAQRAALAALTLLIAVSIGILAGPLRARADGWVGTFWRDSANNLDVNCKIGCASTSQVSPGYSRLEDGTTTNLGKIDSSGELFSATCNTGTCAQIPNPYSNLSTSTTGLETVSVGFSWQEGLSQFAPNLAIPTQAHNAAGVPLVQDAGDGTAAIASGAGTVVVKSVHSGIGNILVTTTGTAAFTCYDNSSTGSGTIIGIIPASAAVGMYPMHMPAVNGITCVDPASGPAVTVSFL